MAAPSAPTGRITGYSFDSSSGSTIANIRITLSPSVTRYSVDIEIDGLDWVVYKLLSFASVSYSYEYLTSVALELRGNSFRIGVRAVNSDGASERTVLQTSAGFDTTYTPIDVKTSGFRRASSDDSAAAFEMTAEFDCFYDLASVPKTSMLFAMEYSSNGSAYRWAPIYDSSGEPARVGASYGPDGWVLSLDPGAHEAGAAESLTVNGSPVRQIAFCQGYPFGNNDLNMFVSGGNTVVSLVSPRFPAELVLPVSPLATLDGYAYPVGSEATASWSASHPDYSVQTGAQVEVTAPDGTVATVDIDGDASTYGFTVDQTGKYMVRVRTSGLYANGDDLEGEWPYAYGDWSTYCVADVAYPPDVSISLPGEGETLDTLPIGISWAVEDETGVSAQALAVKSGQSTVYTASPGVDVRSWELGPSTFTPDNGATYTLTITVTGGSSLKTSESVTFSTEWEEPAPPTAALTVTDALGCELAVAFGADESKPETSYVAVARLDADGTSTPIASSVADGQVVADPLPPLNTEFSYVLTAYTAAGAASTATVAAYVDSGGMEAFSFGTYAGTCVLLGLNASSDASVAHSGESYHFALGEDTPALPTFYPDDGIDVTGSKSYVVHTLAEYAAVRALSRDPSSAVCWYRDAWGHRARVQADWTLGYAAQSYSLWTVAASLTETVWEEPLYG